MSSLLMETATERLFMCTLTSVMMMTFKHPVGCARDLQWQIAKPVWGWECCGSCHPGSINGAGTHFAFLSGCPLCPKHFMMTVCLQGQARDSGTQTVDPLELPA